MQRACCYPLWALLPARQVCPAENQRGRGRGTDSPCMCTMGLHLPPLNEATTPSPVPEAWLRAQGDTCMFTGVLCLPGGGTHVRAHAPGASRLDGPAGSPPQAEEAFSRCPRPSAPVVVQQEDSCVRGLSCARAAPCWHLVIRSLAQHRRKLAHSTCVNSCSCLGSLALCEATVG